MHLILSCLFLVFSCVRGLAAQSDNWFDPAFLEADTLESGTGFIRVPSPEVLTGGVVGASIHRYNVKLGYGLWDRVEIGITADLDGYNLQLDGSRNQLFFGRLRLLDAERFGLGLSVGVEGVGFEDLGFRSFGYLPKPSLTNLERGYVVAGGVVPFYRSLMLSVGWGGGALPAAAFFNASLVVMPGLLAMAEYDGRGTNLGLRLLVSPRAKLDLDLIRTQSLDTNLPFAEVLEHNIRFGITYTEPWPFRLGRE
ncbi:MAG: hypothetical protein V4498_09930 [candidate division FCPU426 bacterium]